MAAKKTKKAVATKKTKKAPAKARPAKTAPAKKVAASRTTRSWGRTKGYVVEAAGAPALVLGTPDEVTWAPRPDGGVLVRVSSFDAEDMSKVRDHFAAIPSDGWSLIADRFEVTEPLRCFDAALEGGSVGDAESLEVRLPKGSAVIPCPAARGAGDCRRA